MKEFKDYQKDAILELKDKLQKLLKLNASKTCVLKAPTGSGKTLIVSDTLRKLVSDQTINERFSFVWIAVRMLHEQSKDKLSEYYDTDKIIKCSYFSDLKSNQIGQNEILFINWSSINKRDRNILVRENEEDRNLGTVVGNTRDAGRTIIMIIDESHHTAETENSRELINIISPKVTINMSATPNYIGDELVNIDIERVKREEMIKSEVLVNPRFLELKIGTKTSNEVVIEQAIKMRQELASLYKKEHSFVNPLLLIQLPNKNNEMDRMKEDVKRILDNDHGINEDNGKLAIWLSDDKSENTLKNIEDPDNEVEVLIFKQAISLGWDCPRASILVIFREFSSFSFTIQTIGRIMRMPEFKYYKNEELNKAYVFTNLSGIEIERDILDYITLNESVRKDDIYDKISLTSYFVKRTRERTRLSGEFIKIFKEEASFYKLSEKLHTEPKDVTEFIVADGKILNVDKSGKIEDKGQIELNITDDEMGSRFDMFIWQQCSPFAPVDSSDRMKSAIYSYLKEELGIDKFTKDAQKLVLEPNNILLFQEVITVAKERYITDIVQNARLKGDIIKNETWEVPTVIDYSGKFKEIQMELSIMTPFYQYVEVSEPEEAFARYLDGQKKQIEWWFKNRENESKYFSVYYEKDGLPSGFYVDFVVKLKDGTIGLFDTKLGITADEKYAKGKAEALQKYIREENANGKKLMGGIVIPIGSKPIVSWRINDNEVYTHDFENQENWKRFEL